MVNLKHSLLDNPPNFLGEAWWQIFLGVRVLHTGVRNSTLRFVLSCLLKVFIYSSLNFANLHSAIKQCNTRWANYSKILNLISCNFFWHIFLFIRLLFSFTLYLPYSRSNLLLRHSIPNFPANFRTITL